MHDMTLFATKPIPVVKVGIIGLGERGLRALVRLLNIEGVEVRAATDLYAANVANASSAANAPDMPARDYNIDFYTGNTGCSEICSRKDIDLVYICTEWGTHLNVAKGAMLQDKHVAVEVPLAPTVNSCAELVKIAEERQLHCVLLENCCYDAFALTTIKLAETGKLGNLTHAEGAYVHDLMAQSDNAEEFMKGNRGWRLRAYCHHWGNPYPTHGLGPIAIAMNINRGDRMEKLVSMASENGGPYQARINTTLIKTHRGRTIVLGYDVATPRPYSRSMIMCGTDGFAQKYPRKCIMFAGETEEQAYSLTTAREQEFEHPVTSRWGRKARMMKHDNEMNYVMDMRLVYCLQKGLPMDINVYDAASWSAIAELSEMSAKAGGMPVDIPDFTHGLWKTSEAHKFYE